MSKIMRRFGIRREHNGATFTPRVLGGTGRMSQEWVDALIVFAIGALVGGGELVARYRDNPWRAIQTLPAATYISVNGAASVLALIALVTFGWTSDPNASPEAQRMVRLLAAGFGALAIFRSSLFQVRVGNTDVGVGPVAFLQVILAATDRGVDRKRASDRADKVVRIMKDLDFEVAYNALPPFAIMLMQNLTLEDKNALGDQVAGLGNAESEVPDQAKVLNLGLLLMNYVGEEVLEDAVRGIRGQLKPDTGLLGRRSGGGKAPATPEPDGGQDGAPQPEPAGGSGKEPEPADAGGKEPAGQPLVAVAGGKNGNGADAKPGSPDPETPEKGEEKKPG